MTFPSYRFHPEQGERIVNDPAEHDAAAADGFYETPADFPVASEDPEPAADTPNEAVAVAAPKRKRAGR